MFLFEENKHYPPLRIWQFSFFECNESLVKSRPVHQLLLRDGGKQRYPYGDVRAPGFCDYSCRSGYPRHKRHLKVTKYHTFWYYMENSKDISLPAAVTWCYCFSWTFGQGHVVGSSVHKHETRQSSFPNSIGKMPYRNCRFLPHSAAVKGWSSDMPD